MALRRLHAEQPESFAFTSDNRAWVDGQLAKYPDGRQASAVIPLLWRAQEQEGWVTRPAIEEIARILDMPVIRVLEVATFYTMFNLHPLGRFHIQVCGTTPCMLRGAEDLIALCKERIGPKPMTAGADGTFSWIEVECLGACCNAPMVQIGDYYYEDLDRESFGNLLDMLQNGEVPRPGPVKGRRSSEPHGGATTLTDAGLDYGPEYAREAITLAGLLAYGPDGLALADTPEARPGILGVPVADATVHLADDGADVAVIDRPQELAPGEAYTGADTTVEARLEAPSVPDEPENRPVSDPETTVTAGDTGEEIVQARAEEIVPDEYRPVVLTGPRLGQADDLKRIKGIGPKLESLLHSLGFYHFDQIAAWTPDNVRWVDSHLEGFRGRIDRDAWIAQAEAIVAGEQE